jgi:very-short-patch-repair endonuclease
MWNLLGVFRRSGVNFRRQVNIGAYYADFACHQPALIIEVDGNSHGTDLARTNDDARDDYFRGRGYRVLRFWNGDVLRNPSGVLRVVEDELTQISERGPQ